MFYTVSFVLIVMALILAGVVYQRYVIDSACPGCLAFPLQFLLTAFGVFFATSIGVNGMGNMLGWRLFAALMFGLGSCLGMYSSRQILRKRRN
jgi:disulfide bond formation protein DsbB